jgi:CheY-like chemotaxis protein
VHTGFPGASRFENRRLPLDVLVLLPVLCLIVRHPVKKFRLASVASQENFITLERATMQRVLVVDDHTVIRRGINSILQAWPQWEVSGEAASGEEAIQLAEDLKPDIIIMDISMPGMGGLEATKVIRKANPHVKILLLTLHDSLEWVETALRAGARGYVLKSDAEGELMRALNIVASDGVYASPSLDKDRVKKILSDLHLTIQ